MPDGPRAEAKLLKTGARWEGAGGTQRGRRSPSLAGDADAVLPCAARREQRPAGAKLAVLRSPRRALPHTASLHALLSRRGTTLRLSFLLRIPHLSHRSAAPAAALPAACNCTCAAPASALDCPAANAAPVRIICPAVPSLGGALQPLLPCLPPPPLRCADAHFSCRSSSPCGAAAAAAASQQPARARLRAARTAPSAAQTAAVPALTARHGPAALPRHGPSRSIG